MSEHRRDISDEAARALFRRATELQLAAERREASSEALARIEPTAGLSFDSVVRAAEEAGIAGDHIRVALAEQRLTDAAGIERDRWTARWLRFLVEDIDGIEVTHRIEASPRRVLEALADTTSKRPFEMLLEESYGADAVTDGVLVYRVAALPMGQASADFHGALEVADVRVVLVTIRPDGDATRLRMRAPLYRRGLNLALTGGSAGLLGAGGTAGGAAVGEAIAALAGIASLAAIAVPAAVGAVAGGGIGVWAWRKVHRWGWRKGEGALNRLAKAVALAAEGQAGGEPRALNG